MDRRGQGATEYLLLLAAGIIVVAVVMAFLINSTSVGKETGCAGLNTYLCDNLDSNTETCACYNHNASGYFTPTQMNDGSALDICCNKECAELKSKWNCS